MSARFEFGIDLDQIRGAVKESRKRGLRRAAEYLLTEANKHVPHDEGTLERSGSASVDEDGKRAAVSYNTPYAVAQHENMTLHHSGKGQAKWLENTFTRESETVGQIIATAVREGLNE